MSDEEKIISNLETVHRKLEKVNLDMISFGGVGGHQADSPMGRLRFAEKEIGEVLNVLKEEG